MKRYKPIWSEPHKQTVFGHSVYVNGPPHLVRMPCSSG